MTRRLGVDSRSLGAVVACDAAATSAHRRALPAPFRSSPPVVIAHAGGEGLGPENTLEAMARSVAAGADIIDVDLRMTSDGVIVARHDRDVATSTDGAGNVDELTWREVRALDAAAHWAGEPLDGPVRIPSLRQVLARFPDQRLSLELKQVEPSMAQQLCDELHAAGEHATGLPQLQRRRRRLRRTRACPEVLITTTYRDLDEMRAGSPMPATPWCAPSPIGQPPFGRIASTKNGCASPTTAAWPSTRGPSTTPTTSVTSRASASTVSTPADPTSPGRSSTSTKQTRNSAS